MLHSVKLPFCKNMTRLDVIRSYKKRIEVYYTLTIIIGILIALIMVNTGYAQDCIEQPTAKPHTFQPGTPALASEVNENFDVLFQVINSMTCEIERLKRELLSVNLPGEFYARDTFQIQSAAVRYEQNLDSLIFEMETKADAGSVMPVPAGGLNGAPVLGYVFVTSLAPAEVGFGNVTGTVGLAVTSHPDFDDTPLWDEDNNEIYDDDGIVYHSHWVVLVEDSRAQAGLVVLQKTEGSTLPPTAPMDMYLDSPGFAVLEDGNSIRVVVPFDRVGRNSEFQIDAVTAFMQVDASGETPLLKVERVYDNLSGNLTPNLSIENVEQAPATAWPVSSTAENADSFSIEGASVKYVQGIDTLVFSMDVKGQAAIQIPNAIGQVDGAPVLGYVFPTSLAPESVDFKGQEGTLALAVTTHPDFDDTPLWDENRNTDYADDGAIYHVHWVVLINDETSGAGLTVPSQADTSQLPPTAPMTMYLDSPGFHAFAQGGRLRVIVPAQRVNNITTFNFDAVTAVMAVDASGADPILRVNGATDILSDDLSLPFSVEAVSELSDLN